MRPLLFIIPGVVLLISPCKNQDYVTISGKITDFENLPMDSVSIELKDSNFITVDSAMSAKGGLYSFKTKKNNYFALCAVKKSDYAKSNLEFWTWNVPAHKDLTIDIQIEKIEIYGVNVFKIQGAFPAYTIYMRPMSITRFLDNRKQNETTRSIAPNIDSVEINVSIDGQRLKIYSIQKVNEYAGKQSMTGYFIQTEFKQPKDKYSAIDITLYDRERKEFGKAKYYMMLN